jgi:hypothetical protein
MAALRFRNEGVTKGNRASAFLDAHPHPAAPPALSLDNAVKVATPATALLQSFTSGPAQIILALAFVAIELHAELVEVDAGGERVEVPGPSMRAADALDLLDRELDLLDGHVRAFAHFGAVPHRIAYDNLKLAVRRILVGGQRALTARFTALVAHYALEASFARPATGHDKGGVESRGKNIRLQHRPEQAPAVHKTKESEVTTKNPMYRRTLLKGVAAIAALGTLPALGYEKNQPTLELVATSPTHLWNAVTLTSSLNPSTVGQSVTFTATVSGTPTPTGTVDFVTSTHGPLRAWATCSAAAKT